MAELQSRLSEFTHRESSKDFIDQDTEALCVAQAALEAERAGAARLERALAAALADNAALASALHSKDNTAEHPLTPPAQQTKMNISPIDSFLAD